MAIGDFFDKLGPPLATGLILALLTAAATALVAWRDHVSASTVQLAYLDDAVSQLRADFNSFRAPGGRFTRTDGDAHKAIIEDHERRLREQETRPPRLNPLLEKTQELVEELQTKVIVHGETLRHITVEQERLCQRIQACGWKPATR